MRVKICQFLFGGTLISWSLVGQSIGRGLLKLGHEVDFISTDGIKPGYLPEDLKPYAKEEPSGIYDCQISYTAMHNMPVYLSRQFGVKNRIGIWNYDAEFPPPHMIKYHQACDFICPSSTFSAENLIKAGIPKNKTHVIPHGIDLNAFKSDSIYPLKTDKKIKILWNLATPHGRKNIQGSLDIFGEAFTKKDDVCLVVKANFGAQKKSAYVDMQKAIQVFKKKYPNHAEIKMITEFIPDVVGLYNACDVVMMLSNFECWGLPAHEGLAANKVVISSRHGGQLEFLNDDNSILVDGELVRMPKRYQYWEPNPMARMFKPDLKDGVGKLRHIVNNYDYVLKAKLTYMHNTCEEFTWDNAVSKLMELICNQ